MERRQQCSPVVHQKGKEVTVFNYNVKSLLLGGLVAVALGAGVGAKADKITFVDDSGSLGNMSVTFLFNGQSYTSGTTAGQYNFIVDGQKKIGFCTDVYDWLSPGTWDATKTTVHDPAFGLSQTWYEQIIQAPSQKIDAINYIVDHYIGSQQAPAAQIAIWDLSLNGGVTKNGNNYVWNSVFSATGINIADVYNVEQKALNSPAGPDAIFYNAGPRNDNTRMQDIAFTPVPEVESVAGLAGMLGFGALISLRRRKKQAANN